VVVSHFLLQILTVGNPNAIFYYVSSPQILFVKIRLLQALPKLG